MGLEVGGALRFDLLTFARGWRHYSFSLSEFVASNLQHLLCLLPAACCLLPAARCPMPAARCLLPAACCPLDSRFALHEIEAEIYPETDSK